MSDRDMDWLFLIVLTCCSLCLLAVTALLLTLVAFTLGGGRFPLPL